MEETMYRLRTILRDYADGKASIDDTQVAAEKIIADYLEQLRKKKEPVVRTHRFKPGQVLFIEKAGSGYGHIEGYEGTVLNENDIQPDWTIEGVADQQAPGVFFVQIDDTITERQEEQFEEDWETGETKRIEQEPVVLYESESIWAIQEDHRSKLVIVR